MRKAEECCKKILNHVNQAVKEAENKQVPTPASLQHPTAGRHSSLKVFDEVCVCPQRLEDYQRRLDSSSLKPSENPLILELKVPTASLVVLGSG